MPSPNPVAGAPEELEAEGTAIFTCQSAAAADGTGTSAAVDGYNGAQSLEIQKTGAGTTNATLEGSFDGVVWYACGYQQIDGQSSPTRAVTAIAVAAGAQNHVYGVLDTYPILRCRLSGTAGAVSLTAKVYAVPV